MVKRNNQNSNNSLTTVRGFSCNTHLNPPKITLKATKKTATSTTNKRFQQSAKSSQSPTSFYNHIDYLTIVAEDLPESQFQQLLQVIGDEYVALDENKDWTPGSKAKRYQNKITFSDTSEGGYNRKAPNSCQNGLSLYDFRIELKGTYFSKLDPLQQHNLLCQLNNIPGCKVTRIDTAVDDYTHQQIPLKEMLEADKQGDGFYYKRHDSTTSNKGSEAGQTTHHFGSKNSDKQVKVYNHKGKCLRMETTLKKAHAQEAVNQIINLEQGDLTDEEFNKDIQQAIGGIAVGVIDFRDRSKLKRPDKADKSKTKRLPFYQEFIDKIGTDIAIKPEKQDDPLEAWNKATRWLLDYASKKAAMHYLVYGEEFIKAFIEHGKSKLIDSDYQQIEYQKSQLKDNQFKYPKKL